MFKKLIMCMAVVAAGLGVSSVSFADTSLSSNGFYVGAQGGLGKADFGSDLKNFVQGFFPGDNSSEEGGFAGRLFAGYQFNPFVAVEAGYMVLPTNTYKGSDMFGDYLNVDEKTNAFDIVGKAMLPLNQMNSTAAPITLYAKAGMAYVNSEIDLDGAGGSSTTTSNQWKPEAGLGASYALSQNVSADVSWTHIFGESTAMADTAPNAPSVDFVALGLSYNFA